MLVLEMGENNSETNRELHKKALWCARQYKRAESEVIKILQQIDAKKVFLELGFTSLYDYSTKSLGLSDAVAYAFITVARKASDIPALWEAISEGNISVNTAKRLTSVLTQENAARLLEKATVMSQRELEREIVQINPRLSTRESIRYVTRDRMEIKVGLSQEFVDKLRRIQDLEAQRQDKGCKMEAVLEVMIDEYLDRHDPLRQAERASLRKAKERSGKNENELVARRAHPDGITPAEVNSPESQSAAKRLPLTADLKHQINLRDRGFCTYQDTDPNKACQNRRWLHVHHLTPVSLGGKNDIENLQTLCSGHHRLLHH